MIDERSLKIATDYISRQAEIYLDELHSWQAVGKNYATEKDGKPFSDPVKALQGVDGIKKVSVGDISTHLENNGGWDLDITDKSLSEIEDAIEGEKAKAEADYNLWDFLLSYFPIMYKQYDDLIKTIFLAYDRDFEKNVSERCADDFFDFSDIIRECFLRAFDGEVGKWRSNQLQNMKQCESDKEIEKYKSILGEKYVKKLRKND